MLHSKLQLEIWVIVMFVQFFKPVWIMMSHQSAEAEKLPTSFQVATLFPLIFIVLKNPLAPEDQCVILSYIFHSDSFPFL
jgi:membrane protein insertase Oxa1/YidC/SpoIIIJ